MKLHINYWSWPALCSVSLSSSTWIPATIMCWEPDNFRRHKLMNVERIFFPFLFIFCGHQTLYIEIKCLQPNDESQSRRNFWIRNYLSNGENICSWYKKTGNKKSEFSKKKKTIRYRNPVQCCLIHRPQEMDSWFSWRYFPDEVSAGIHLPQPLDVFLKKSSATVAKCWK